MRRLCSFILSMLLLFSLCSCSLKKEEQPQQLSIYAMNTYMTMIAYGDHAQEALQECSKAINAMEKRLSRTIPDSEISSLNAQGHASLSEDTAVLVNKALTYCEETSGCFDITVAPLVSAWGITTETPRVPSPEEISTLLSLVGREHIQLEKNEAALSPNCAIDLGGIAKGYASDIVSQIFAEKGVTSGAVSLGGNVYVCGLKPDGNKWSTAIQDPNSDGYAALLSLTDTFAVTSGGYQRFYTAEDGTVYQHIIDPFTGYPVSSGLMSVSIICPDGTKADAYSTALYVMGEKDAIQFWKSHMSDFDMILITSDNRLLYTPNLSDAITAPEGNTYTYQVIT